MIQHVKHLSGLGETYEVVSFDNHFAWCCRLPGPNDNERFWMPKKDYRLVSVWVEVPHRIETGTIPCGKTINPDYVYSGEDCIATLHCRGQYRIKTLIIEKLR